MSEAEDNNLNETASAERDAVFFDLLALPKVRAALRSLRKERRRWALALVYTIGTAMFVSGWWLGMPLWGGVAAALVFRDLSRWIEKKVEAWCPPALKLAALLERLDPALAGRLKAAVEQAGPDGNFSYMQQRLFGEVEAIAANASWERCVPAWGRFLSGTLFVAVRVCAFLSVVWWLLAPTPKKAAVVAKKATEVPNMVPGVSPGNVEIEKGTRFTVSARMSEMTPGVALCLKDAGGSPVRIPMQEGVGEPLYGASIEALETDAVYWVESPVGSSPQYTVRVFEFPKLLEATATVRYPEGVQPRERVFEDARKLSVPEGSEVVWDFRFNKPLKSAVLRGKDGKEESLVLGENQVAGRWILSSVRESSEMVLQIADPEGRRAREDNAFSLRVVPNQPPKLRPLLPRNDARFTAIEEVDFDAEVWDDAGLKRWGMTLQVGKNPPSEVVLGEGGKAGQKIRMSKTEFLERLDVKVGDSLSWYFWAEDSFGNGGVRRVESDLMLGRVRAFEEEYRQGEDQSSEGGKGGPQVLEIQKQVIAASWNLRKKGGGAGTLEAGDKKALETVRASEAKVQEMVEEAAGKEEDPLRQAAYTDAMEHLEKALAALAQAGSSKEQLETAIEEERAVYDALTHAAPNAYNMVRSKKGKPGEAQEQTRQMSNLEFAKEEDRYQSKTEAKSEKENKERTEMEELFAQLKALARRQDEVAERMRELEARMHEGADPKEKEAARRELKRLSDEQKALARELEDAQQKAASKNEALSQQREQLDKAREAAQKAASAIEKGSLDEARASTARVSEKLREGSESLRRQLSGKTREAARNLQEKAQELQEQEKKVAEALSKNKTGPAKLVAEDARALSGGQQERLKELQNDIQQVAEAVEGSEPVFSKALQEAHRATLQNQTEAKLKVVRDALLMRQDEVARRAEKSVAKDLEELTKGLEAASNGVLGDDAEALKQARAAVDEIAKALSGPKEGSTIASAAGKQSQGKAGDKGKEAGSGAGEKGGEAAKGNTEQPAQEGMARGKDEAGKGGKPRSTANAEGRGQTPEGAQAKEKGGSGKEGSPAEADNTGGATTAGGVPVDAGVGSFAGGGEGVPAQDIGRIMERLDRVEALLERPQLRAGVSRVQQVADEIRSDMKRHATKPNRKEVEQRLLAPLAQLRDAISSELARREGRESDVPVDRDPVPRKYEASVRRYYEALGGGR